MGSQVRLPVPSQEVIIIKDALGDAWAATVSITRPFRGLCSYVGPAGYLGSTLKWRREGKKQCVGECQHQSRENVLPGRTQQLPNEEVIVSLQGQRTANMGHNQDDQSNHTRDRDSWKDMKGRAGLNIPHQMSSFIDTLENYPVKNLRTQSMLNCPVEAQG